MSSPRLALALAVLVIVPLLALGWFGQRVSDDETTLLDAESVAQLEHRLSGLGESIERVVNDRGAEAAALLEALPSPVTGEALREAAYDAPFANQAFLVGEGGDLLFPNPRAPRSNEERYFLERTAQLWDHSDQLTTASEGEASARQGWYTHFWRDGLELIYWRRNGAQTLGIELNRMRVLADLIGTLPESLDGASGAERVRLVNAEGNVLHQWGDHELDEGSSEPALAMRRLGAPIESWRLELYAPPSALQAVRQQSRSLERWLTLSALALALLALALFLYREGTRRMKEAMQRVNFVGQVSHELKTPLTNIRMYAELLAARLPDDDEKAARHAEVIVGESERLSRLIGNVLTFASHQRGEARSAPLSAASVDELVEDVLRQFEPSLERHGFEVDQDLNAPDLRLLDTDAVTQVLTNLVSNAEKYAREGGHLKLRTKQDAEGVHVWVSDAGPGVPARHAARIFEPFERLNASVSEGVSGAGLGLSLSRDLARAHGGDLVLETRERGACFHLSLSAERA
ncbi:MAG: HAMP domain-containing sensor histidine kinase [Myxococcota bacterium]